MRRSKNTLLGRVYEHASLEARRDAEALYAFIDPVIRRIREGERSDEPNRSLSDLRASVESVRSAEVEKVDILEARKVSEEHGGRPAALVRSIVRYNDGPTPRETRTIWVQDAGVWYSTDLDERSWTDA